jgi:NADH-quinone oxidoreductase subunit L
MGGLKKYMPLTYWTVLIGAFANAGLPPFAGFFSKDSILEAVHLSATPGAHLAYWLLLGGVLAGGVYSFRLVFMAFHGEERFDKAHPPHESPWVVTLPLVLLAIPSVAAGWLIGPVLFGGFFGDAIKILPAHPGLEEMTRDFHGVPGFIGHGVTGLPFWLALGGAAAAWYLYVKNKELPKKIAMGLGPVYALIERKYGFDELYSSVFAAGARAIGSGLWKGGDQGAIDGLMVNGSARVVGWFSGVVRLVQSGLIYWYAFVMLFGVLLALTWFLFLAHRV